MLEFVMPASLALGISGSSLSGAYEEAVVSGLLAALIDLGSGPVYVNWWVVHISAANLVVIGVMVLLFVAALFLPFPKGRRP